MSAKHALLYSGGMDSLIAWYYLGLPDALYVDMGHKYAPFELAAMARLPVPNVYYELKYGRYFEEEDAHVPGRNLFLATVAAAAGYDDIWLVCQAGEQTVPDRSPQFFVDATVAMRTTFGRAIDVRNVFPTLYKHEMVAWYLEKGHAVENLINSWSCYHPVKGRECGECSACFRKYIALAVNRIPCRACFLGDVYAWGEEHYLPRLDEYDETRRRVIKLVYDLAMY